MARKVNKNQRGGQAPATAKTWWQARGLTRHALYRNGRKRTLVWLDKDGNEVQV